MNARIGIEKDTLNPECAFEIFFRVAVLSGVEGANSTTP
jgi:hypothetical protein